MCQWFWLTFTALYFKLSISSSGQGLLSQSALQLNNQDAYAAAGYHSNPGLDTTIGRSGQVGAVHIYNQVQTTHSVMSRHLFSPLLEGCSNPDRFQIAVCDVTVRQLFCITGITNFFLEAVILVHFVSKAHIAPPLWILLSLTCRWRPAVQLLS